MKGKTYQLMAVGSISALLASPVLAGNLLTNSDFEDFVGPFPDGLTSVNGPITADPATWDIWRVWPRFQSVNGTTLIPPTSGPTPFPTGWGGNNFAQHHQELTPDDTSDDGDYTDQIKQGIDGRRVVPNVPVSVSFRYINTEPGRLVRVQVYGINAPQVWSEFASWDCQYPQFGPAQQTCTLLHQADMPLDYDENQGWKDSGIMKFTPTASYDVVAVGISLGGTKGYARGVDDVVLAQNQPPIALCQNPTVSANGSCQANASVNNGSYDPDGDEITIVQMPPGPYPLGNTSVILTATDPEGASASCTGIVKVKDMTAPVISSVIANPNTLWPPNHKMVPVQVTAATSDNCTVAPVCTITSVTSDEPDNGLGDGDTANDIVVTGDLSVNLRAERSGTGNGRVYTVNGACMDAAGNSATWSKTVTVPHDKGK